MTTPNVGSFESATLPEDIFDGLSSLTTLILTGADNLSTLPEDLFDGLSSLEYLQMDNNGLSALPEDVFDGLSSLEELRLDHNRLSSLPDGLFDGLTSLRKLELLSNTGAPFTFTAELEASGDHAVVVKVAQGIPFPTSVTLSAEGGSLSAETVELSGGSTQSATVTVTPNEGRTPRYGQRGFGRIPSGIAK